MLVEMRDEMRARMSTIDSRLDRMQESRQAADPLDGSRSRSRSSITAQPRLPAPPHKPGDINIPGRSIPRFASSKTLLTHGCSEVQPVAARTSMVPELLASGD
eukprot:741926-Prymnesium_polylepis.1